MLAKASNLDHHELIRLMKSSDSNCFEAYCSIEWCSLIVPCLFMMYLLMQQVLTKHNGKPIYLIKTKNCSLTLQVNIKGCGWEKMEQKGGDLGVPGQC